MSPPGRREKGDGSENKNDLGIIIALIALVVAVTLGAAGIIVTVVISAAVR